jgi:UDP-N-acetylmuramoyl-L-alanyl-D-glutamate--2,6-diaminopimelate ligase
MELERLVAALAPEAVLGSPDPVEVRDLAYDARAVTPGAAFFAVPGEHADGHDFAVQAVENGAVALVVEHAVEPEVPQLVVPSARAAMATAADAFFGEPTRELEVAGVTGTSGKTTTAYLLYSVLEAAGRAPGLLGTVESRVGGEVRPVVRTTPEAIDLQRTFREMLDAGNRSVALEASSHASVLHRLDRVRFDVLVFTNLSQDHLDFHGDLEDYFAAKASLFDGRFPRAVNADDAYGRRLGAELRFGVETATADVYCEAYELRPDRTELFVRTPDGALSLEPRLRGRFNVDNVLCAVTLALLLEVPLGAIELAVSATGAPPGRFEPVETGRGFGVIVDYAHTPAGIAAVLASARPLTGGRLLCVFGAGGDRDRTKRPLLGRAAAEADLPVVTSDNPRSEDPAAIIHDILGGFEGTKRQPYVEGDRERAIRWAIQHAGPADTVLIAGKGHETEQIIGPQRLPFDDREVARECLTALFPLANTSPAHVPLRNPLRV